MEDLYVNINNTQIVHQTAVSFTTKRDYDKQTSLCLKRSVFFPSILMFNGNSTIIHVVDALKHIIYVA